MILVITHPDGKVERLERVDKQVKVRTCSSSRHSFTSEIPYNQVPEHLFLQNPENPKSRNCKTCYHCRKYGNDLKFKKDRQRKVKHDEAIELYKKDKNSIKFIPCYNHIHHKVSKIPWEEVPASSFIVDENDPNSALHNSCKDCRDFMRTERAERVKNKKGKLIKELKSDEFLCACCIKKKNISERAKNKDGTDSSSCLDCKEVGNRYSKDIKLFRQNIKFEKMIESECSCQHCKGIFVRTDQGYALKIDTYEHEGKRYVNYNNNTYLARDFLNAIKDQIEYRIIELDHLDEAEQRKRGIIGPNDKAIPKRNCISDCNKRDAENEARITQNVCGHCHLKITISREKGKVIQGEELKKKEKVNDIKREIGCCQKCGFWDGEVLRFFEFDHLEVEKKLDKISNMIKEGRYTIEDILAEIEKCRLLCRHCHTIHTFEQREKGIIDRKKGINKLKKQNSNDENINPNDNSNNSDDIINEISNEYEENIYSI